MLGCSQETVGHGDQGDMFFNRLEIPYLMLIETFGLAFFMIDFNRPAMASNSGDATRLPIQAIRNKQARGIRQVGLLVVDD